MTTPTPPRATRSTHTAGSAAMLLMMSALLSGLLGLVRIKYINYLFGAGIEQDAYRAAFKWPDLLAYFLVGGASVVMAHDPPCSTATANRVTMARRRP